ncbi:unnamed protein product [Somion occarium]|uniref:Uncharacterized protein n=1 Tax=Somion occarium TaxID=3059160 RepID=A0ABP1D1F4_9APHY
MRRLAAFFGPKRSDRSEASDNVSESHSQHTVQSSTSKSKARAGFLRTFSRNGGGTDAEQPAEQKPRRHPMPSLVRTDAPSSSSSSSGGPHTPDDERASLVRGKSDFNPWLQYPGPEDARVPNISPGNTSQVRPSLKDTRTHLSPWSHSQPRHSHEDTDEDTSSVESSESEGAPALLNTTMAPSEYFRVLTVNAIAPPFSPPPLLHIHGCPVFPRSSNRCRALLRDESLRSGMHKKHLLCRLAQGNLSPSDELALKGFANRTHGPAPKRPSLLLDDTALKAREKVGTHSQGLKRWVTRPCFEERMVLYVPLETGEVVARSIPGINLGVAELEYSEALEVLAGLYESPLELSTEATANFTTSPTNVTPPLSMSPSSAPASPAIATPLHPPASASAPSLTGHKPQPQAVSPTQNRNSYKAAPSPLRIEHSSAPSPTFTAVPLTASSSQTSQTSTILASHINSPTIILSPSSPEPPRSPPSPPRAKLGVRFAEEEKDDQFPLGYVLRVRQKREQKARFLEAERLRRIHEKERRKFEEERRRQEAEKKKWEQERSAWEREKRAAEEERKKRLYAEELAAARSRRESVRFGTGPRADGDTPLLWDGSDRDRERERRGRQPQETYTRPVYDVNAPTPRRQGSDPLIPPPIRSRKESSPASSRPPSAGGSGSSRPPSMYSTPQSSVPDITVRDRRESKGSRRGSMTSVADSSHRSVMDRSSFPPSFSWNGNMNQGIPPVPPLPLMPMVPVVPYMMDMPLLPPTPPFMMQQFGNRPQQQRSHSSSPTVGTNRLPASQSTDRVNQHGTSPVRHHERRASGDIAELQKSRASTPRYSLVLHLMDGVYRAILLPLQVTLNRIHKNLFNHRFQSRALHGPNLHSRTSVDHQRIGDRL